MQIDVADFLIEHRDRLKTALEREEWKREDTEWLNLCDEEAEPTATETPAHEWHICDLVFINHP